MRISDFPLIFEIKEEYLQLRRDGHNRTDTTQILMQNYQNELFQGAQDDGVLFWIGLADAQYSQKELEEEVAKQASLALDHLEISAWNIHTNDISQRRRKYQTAPMPEKKFSKPRRKFRCEWQIGDTFAYQVRGPYAENLGISGKHFLFRKVDACEFGDGRLMPIVTLSFWEKESLPKNTQEFMTVPMLKIRSGGRCDSPKDKFEYRTELVIKNKKQLQNIPFQYLGNFQGVPLPEDEIIFSHAGYYTMMLPERIDQDCSLSWKWHMYCTNGVWLSEGDTGDGDVC